MDLGQGYAQAGQGIAQGLGGLAEAMQQYHKRHVAYDQQMKFADALSNIGISPDGKITTLDTETKGGPKIQPIIDKKALEQFRTSNQREWDKNTGGLQLLNHLAVTGLQKQLGEALEAQTPRGKLAQRTLDQPLSQFTDPTTGQTSILRNTPSGAVPMTSGTDARQVGIQNRHNINTAIKLRKELFGEIKGGTGYDPETLLSPNIVAGVQDKSGKYVPVDIKTGVEPTVFGIPDEKGEPQWFPAAEWAKFHGKAQQYQQLGKVAFSGLSGGKQDAPVMVRTPAEARSLPPGTLVQTPDGRVGRTKGTPAAAVEEEATVEEE